MRVTINRSLAKPATPAPRSTDGGG